MISRFFCPDRLPPAGTIELPDALAHHAVRVLRLADGDPLVLFDGHGGEYAARLVAHGRQWGAELLGHKPVERESPLELVLVQALASGDKMDWIVQKAVELGVAAVVPVRAERSVLRLSDERAARRRSHWQQVAVAACEQSGRNRVPQIAAIADLRSYLAESRAVGDRLVLAPDAAHRLSALARPAGPVHLLIGPEGGWTPDELAACQAAGVTRVGIGPRVLRTETAGLAAVSALQARWGDF
ncbi:MAG TPA: 16S rRNA (uracil(1498)-N(3))-methyltransferase [Rhodocyclaceae bacterium]|nr:16S rRNA (uracil(1498)-N(3))-methyltransferase [Rhodocyclaceae bacterium]